MSIAEPTTKQWSRAEYYRLSELGCFVDERTELIGGEIFVVSPQKFQHYASIERVAEQLKRIFGDDYWVRTQAPLTLGDESEPEPDVSVVHGAREDYRDHPTSAVLVVEVSASSLAFDLREKASLYAASGIEDYWVVNLVEKQIKVCRSPMVDPEQKFGWRYSDRQTFVENGEIAPLEQPAEFILVTEIF